MIQKQAFTNDSVFLNELLYPFMKPKTKVQCVSFKIQREVMNYLTHVFLNSFSNNPLVFSYTIYLKRFHARIPSKELFAWNT